MSQADERCPYCDYLIKDFWDYSWDGRETLDIECPSCDEDITISRFVDITYTVTKYEAPK